MTRDEKINFLNGVVNGTRSLDELVENKEEVNYSMMTTCELKTFLDILYPNHFGQNNHGPHAYTKVFNEDEIMDICRNDVPKRLKLEKVRHTIGLTFTTIHYKDEVIAPVTHIEYDWMNRSLSVFPTSNELALYQQMNDKELATIFENKLTELLKENKILY
jgi:hypothetical protein